MNLLLVSKHNRKLFSECSQTIKITCSQRQQYQARNDHQNSTSRNAPNYLIGVAR